MHSQSGKVLFICTGNAGRSQMAQLMFQKLAPEHIKAYSAGVQPWGNCHPFAIELMARNDFDMSDCFPKHVNKYKDDNFDIVVTIGDKAIAQCPDFIATTRIMHWDIEDPAEAGSEEEVRTAFQETFQNLKQRLPGLLKNLKTIVRPCDVDLKPAICTVATHPLECVEKANEPFFNPSKHLPMFVKAGFNVIELTCYSDEADFNWRNKEEIAKLKKIADDLGVKIFSLHPPDIGNLVSPDPARRQKQIDVIFKFADIAERLGAAALSCHAGLDIGKSFDKEDVLNIFTNSLQKLHEHFCNIPVTLCLETLGGQTWDETYCLSNETLLEVVQKFGQSSMGIVLDTGHSNIAKDLYTLTPSMKRKLYTLHLHDNNGLKDQHLPPGSGNIDWKRLISILKKNDYHGPIMIEVCARKSQQELPELLDQCKIAADHLISLMK